MENTIFTTIAATLGGIIGLMISLILNAGIVWIACTGLTLIGIKITFSWKMVILFTACVIISKEIKKVVNENKKKEE